MFGLVRILDTLSAGRPLCARLLRRYPLFALTAALSLAVGIGANTAVFTIANSLLRFSPDGVAEPDRLVDIGRSFERAALRFQSRLPIPTISTSAVARRRSSMSTRICCFRGT